MLAEIVRAHAFRRLMVRRNVILSVSLRYVFFAYWNTVTENVSLREISSYIVHARFLRHAAGIVHSGTNGKPYIATTDKLDVISVYLIYAKHLYPMDVIPLRCYLTYRPIWNAVADNAIETRGSWCAINRSRELKRCTRSTGTKPYISWKLLIIPLLQSGQVGRARCTCADSFRPMPKRGSATCGCALFNVL